MPRLGLFHKVLLWFFLNLCAVGAIGLGYVSLGAKLPPGSVFHQFLGERFRTAVRLMGRELGTRPRAEWDEALARYEHVYGVRLGLYTRLGRPLAGSLKDLPEAVALRLAQSAPPPPGQAARAGDPSHQPPPFPSQDGRRPGSFSMKTANPATYWSSATLLLPLGPPNAAGAGKDGTGQSSAGRLEPAVLVAASATRTAGGLFMDLRPLYAAVGLVLAFSALWWWPFLRGVTRPLTRMTRAAEAMARGRFDTPLDAEAGSREIGRLAEAIRHMAERLGAQLAGQKRFLGDVAHELASPLARIRLGLGVLEHQLPDDAPEAFRRRLDQVAAEAEAMAALVDELLSFSRAQAAGDGGVRLEPVALKEALERVAAREAGAAAVRVDAPEGLAVLAVPELLDRAVGNLVRNAVCNAGAAGPITVRARAGAGPDSDGGRVTLTVADLGPGVPEADLPRLFEPFYRVDASRDAATGGAGLGLALVREAVLAMDGHVACENAQPGFRVTMNLRRA